MESSVLKLTPNGSFDTFQLFATVIVVGAGRYYGVDAVLEQTKFVRYRPKLRYLLG